MKTAHRPHRLHRLWPAVGLAAAIFQGCLGDATAPDTMDDALAAWRRSEPERYSYTVQYVCFCIGGPVHVVANRDSVISAEADSGGRGGPSLITDKQKYSIESLIAEVGAELAHKHDSQRIEYHQTYGFPESVYIDFEKQAADEEFGLIISDFTPITAAP